MTTLDTVPTDTITISRDRLDRITDLLETCDGFFRASSPATLQALDELLTDRGISGGPGWLVDTLGLTGLQLRVTASHPSNETGDE
jgi:hypothetical protein